MAEAWLPGVRLISAAGDVVAEVWVRMDATISSAWRHDG